MHAVPFDTLKLARKLEASGMSNVMAAGTSEAMSGAELATRADVVGVRGGIAGLRSEFKSDIELLRRDIISKSGSMLVISVGVLLTAIRYLPKHP